MQFQLVNSRVVGEFVAEVMNGGLLNWKSVVLVG